ncbi:hypothetical protein DYB34_013126 [Aphanomyces astaci]|uniref:Uncharacterized protein n=1 Tax=Aphanomyces astaci TaxID=112090 RepID=A0A418CBQ6_APHAT|nr:hypothetical protein DYB34_013126 [Aphanomyces astaci]
MVRPFQLLSSDLQAARVQPAIPPGLRHPPRRFSALASTGTCFSTPSMCEPNLVTTVHDHDAKSFQCALCLDLSFSAFSALRRHRTTRMLALTSPTHTVQAVAVTSPSRRACSPFAIRTLALQRQRRPHCHSGLLSPMLFARHSPQSQL